MDRVALSIFQIVLGVALVGLILLQAKGAGLGSAFGGNMGFYQTRRGVEKIFFYLTIIIAVLFFLSAIAGLLL